jgi:catechol 2,3-dioxygenase
MNEFIPINTSRTEAPIDPQTRIGHVHLKVSDLAHSISFYTDILGFEITGRLGTQAAFLSAGGYHHHIGLNTWESAGGSPPPATSTGLYHFAVLVPTREELARALKRLVKHEWPIDGMSDHGVSEAIYLKDPDGNGIEISADRPVEKWPLDSEGNFRMYTRPLDYDSLLSELKE